MPRRRRNPMDLRLAHNWEKIEVTSTDGLNSVTLKKWQCTKCGVTVNGDRESKPGRYIRFEAFRANTLAETIFIHRTSGMLCDEIVTWKVMET